MAIRIPEPVFEAMKIVARKPANKQEMYAIIKEMVAAGAAKFCELRGKGLGVSSAEKGQMESFAYNYLKELK